MLLSFRKEQQHALTAFAVDVVVINLGSELDLRWLEPKGRKVTTAHARQMQTYG